MGKVQSRLNKRKSSHSSQCSISDDDKRDQTAYEYINKRKYFSSYILPLDSDEVDRLTLQHYIFNNIWGGDFSSPVCDLLERGGAKVLDVGCGPGVFVLEMANKYPKNSFVGMDIANNYPLFIKPENASFQRADITNGLPFPDNSFDFVYMRFMMLAITIENWQFAIDELVRVCKPGGWIEVMERDIYWYNEGEMVNEWRTRVVEGLRKERNIELNISSHIPGYFTSNKQLTNFASTAYAEVVKWGAKNFSNAVSHKFPGDYETLVEIAMEELEKNKAFDKSYRFWAMKKHL
ncbi:7924_t:CDS:2 [Acaulospora colombiana]|uniref:7924_t:CDS:1 n=1 Tax=Acaulospora colombiana TaxID=27376 RepID=A0ACA9KPK2_9GLOM|nr:7924_t:CDS:2 [Acaulospora colombiana]